MPIVGIGAPVAAWLPAVAEKFHTDLLLPPHYDVANAVGAAAGKVMTVYRILVQNHESEGISVYAPWGRKHYPHGVSPYGDEDGLTQKDRMDQAVVALAVGRKKLMAEMERRGIVDFWGILVEQEDARTGRNSAESLQGALNQFADRRRTPPMGLKTAEKGENIDISDRC